jgi:hypothetical protein
VARKAKQDGLDAKAHVIALDPPTSMPSVRKSLSPGPGLS